MKAIIVDIETTGLNPLTERITCIGAKINGSFFIRSNEDEKGMLSDFWEYVRNSEVNKLVGWNINEFDWKWLKIRSLINGVKISKYFSRKDRIDLMLILKTDRWQKLDTYAKLLLNREKTHDNPIELWKNKEIDKLSEYNRNDVELTYDIFQRCLNYGIIKDD